MSKATHDPLEDNFKFSSNTIYRLLSDSCKEIGFKMDQILLDRYCERVLGYKITKTELIMNHTQNIHVEEFPDGSKDFYSEKDGKKILLLIIKPYIIESDFINNKFSISAKYL